MQRTRECLVELQKLASSDTNECRDQILDRVTDLFFLTSDSQGDAEKAVFGDVLERIAYELETAARAHLAERLAETGKAPHRLVFRLANDEIGVARPILEKSPCLSDDDLVKIVEVNGQAHMHAISNRDELSALVTDAIVEHGDDAVLTNMAENKGAEFSNHGLERLSMRAGENSELFSALEVRADIPREKLEEIKRTIAVRLWAEVIGISSDISGEEIDAIVEAKASEMNLDSPDRNASANVLSKRRHTITEDMVLAFARSRMLTETIQCLSLMSGVPFSRVSHCLLEADLSVLAVLCKASKFKNTTFAALIQLRSASNPIHVRIIADSMRHYDMLNYETARNTIQAVQKRAAESEQNG